MGRKRLTPARPERTEREQAWFDAHPVCQRCRRQRSAHIHHVKGRRGKLRDTSPLLAVCAVCHDAIHSAKETA